MKFLLSLLFLFSFVSCMSSNSNRNPAGIPPGLNGNLDSLDIFTNASFEQVGPNGTVYFYYLTPELESSSKPWAPDHELQLNIVKCSKNSVIEKKSDCIKEPGSKVIVVPYLVALASMKSYLNVYLNAPESVVPLEEKYTRLQKFISAHGERAADPAEVAQLKTEVEKFKAGEEAVLIANYFLKIFTRRLKTRIVETHYHDGLSRNFSLVLDMFRSFIEVVASPNEDFLTPVETEIIRVEGQTTYKYLPAVMQFKKSRDYIIEVEGQSYLSPKGQALLSSMQELGFGHLHCLDVPQRQDEGTRAINGKWYGADAVRLFVSLCAERQGFGHINVNLVDVNLSRLNDQSFELGLINVLFPNKKLVEVKRLPDEVKELYDKEFKKYSTSVYRITNGERLRSAYGNGAVYRLVDAD